LGIGVFTQIGFEVVPKNSLERVPDIFARERDLHTIKIRHPSPKDTVRETSAAILVARPLSFEKPLHFAAVLLMGLSVR
jgi:hypothetical protein